MKMILIVEDNTDINNMIYDYLCKKQFECVQAFSGTEALLYLNSSDFDIIILDLMLPGINGNELIEKVKPEIKTPIIILSAKDELDTKVNSLMLGADDYITKPFSVNYLQAKVENILARRKMLQAYYCKVGYEEGNENKEKDRSVQLSARDAAFLNKLAKIMEEQLGNPELNVDQLVSYFSLSRTNFFHKLKSLTGMAPIMYIKEIRMRKAAELIKENQYTMAEIAYMVGFSDPHYFSKSFKSYWGMTSTEYAKNQIGR